MLAAFLAAAPPCAAEDPIAIARAGTAALEARRFGDALEAFTRAAALRPGDASLRFGAGIAAFVLGRDELAQVEFEGALALDPEFLPATQWLADLHYRAGRLSEAIAIYEGARRRPGGQHLEPQLADWRRERAVQSRFSEIRTRRFTVLFDATAGDLRARDVVDRLEAAYWRIGTMLGVYPTRRITIVLYTREQFREITRLAGWSVAAYDGRIRVRLDEIAGEPGDLDRLLSHEFVHAVVAMVGGRTVPAWLNEGLATVLAGAGARDAEAPLQRSASRPALSDLHSGFIRLSVRDAEIAYASSARAVRRLIEQHGLAVLVAVIEDLGRGATFEDAFQQRTGIRYEDFAASVARE